MENEMKMEKEVEYRCRSAAATAGASYKLTVVQVSSTSPRIILINYLMTSSRSHTSLLSSLTAVLKCVDMKKNMKIVVIKKVSRPFHIHSPPTPPIGVRS